MHLGKNIAHYIDMESNIITFGMTYPDEYSFNHYILPDILKNVKTKKVICEDISEKETFLKFTNSVFVIDIDNVSFPRKSTISTAQEIGKYMCELRDFCYKNNNSVILKKNIFHNYDNTTNGTSVLNIQNLSPKSMVFSSDVILMLNKGIIKSVKNRYHNIDLLNYSITAIIREERINEIFKD